MPPDARRWYHVVITTYGAWLYGDSRGFRTRHHREHVEGDYKNPPPPGKYAAKAARSRASLRQPPVVIPTERREAVGRALQRELTRLRGWVLTIAVGGQHAHLLVKLPRGTARKVVGRAKREAALSLRAVGWRGRLWGARGRAIPIRRRSHQVRAYHYIGAHADEGAWVGVWKEDPTQTGDA